jgi:hypothetical protein
MSDRKQTKKLTLSRQTLRTLSSHELDGVGGAYHDPPAPLHSLGGGLAGLAKRLMNDTVYRGDDKPKYNDTVYYGGGRVRPV